MRTKLLIVLLSVVCSTAWSQNTSNKWYIDRAKGYSGVANSNWLSNLGNVGPDSPEVYRFATLLSFLYDGIGVDLSTPSEQDKWICSQVLREYTGISVGDIFKVGIYDSMDAQYGREYVIGVTNARTLQFDFLIARYVTLADLLRLIRRLQ